MTAYTDFHYSPTGSGVISGAQVLEQTEQGINGLGQYVQDNVSGAIDTANQALTTAQSADSNATTAINLANSFNAQIIAANQTAGNALTTAQSAQNTANSASLLATTANNNAATALNTANAASSAVTTLTGTVNSLGNRMTTAENNISTNAGNITTLQNNLATTNANVTAAANAASTAQATATSAQSTATLARNQAYVLRYTGTTITGGGTIAYADIDNTDNIKAGDKIIDISGAIYAIASVDTTNQTVTVGASPVINLFCDAENLIPAANDAYDLGSSSYQWNNLYAKNYYYNGTAWGLDQNNTWTGVNTFSDVLKQVNSTVTKGTNPSSDTLAFVTLWGGTGVSSLNNALFSQRGYVYADGSTSYILYALENVYGGSHTSLSLKYDPNDTISQRYALMRGDFRPYYDNSSNLGIPTLRWKTLWANGINSVLTDTVEWHNSHYRGINLISDGHFANMAALLTAIRAQDWSDIYIGDYVELTFTYEGASRTVKFYVGEIDKFYKVGNTSLETHHLVMVTGDLGINQVMNDSNTTAGGYAGSKAHTVTLPALYAILNPLFNNAILTHREHLSNTVISDQTVSLSLDDGNGAVTYSCNNFPVYSSGDPNTPGCVTAGTWYDCNLVLMSEIEMFGSNRFSSSGIDDIMCPEGQIAAFKYNRDLQTLNRTINTWLRNVNSASRFCYCYRIGNSVRAIATSTFIRLRPRFLIG